MVQEYKAYRLIPLMIPLFNGWTIPLKKVINNSACEVEAVVTTWNSFMYSL